MRHGKDWGGDLPDFLFAIVYIMVIIPCIYCIIMAFGSLFTLQFGDLLLYGLGVGACLFILNILSKF
jgi:hypothetical protein